MNKNFTTRVNNSNVKAVQQQILMKLGPNPFYSTMEQGGAVLTDFDTFPYPRFYRGVYNSSEPGVIEREAGFRQREDNCYKLNLQPMEDDYTTANYCFQAPCSTVYPCYPTQPSESGFSLTSLNRECIPIYR